MLVGWLLVSLVLLLLWLVLRFGVHTLCLLLLLVDAEKKMAYRSKGEKFLEPFLHSPFLRSNDRKTVSL
uniref:Putative secreted protein n=1 Tax=Psorophora albipes TaxID=869069 RepID=T1E2X6_9DIPT